jgi:FtsP/CotA-like multicopper oxidase with cupredoxin domain
MDGGHNRGVGAAAIAQARRREERGSACGGQGPKSRPEDCRIDLTARVAEVEVATAVQAWTYDGSITGPLIRTHVGDRLIVHFTNDLPQATTIHWHVVRVPIEMDGVPDISQPAMKRGETFTYVSIWSA